MGLFEAVPRGGLGKCRAKCRAVSRARRKKLNFPIDLAPQNMVYYSLEIPCGDIAQLVERLNGIEKVRGSTPLISTKFNHLARASNRLPER